MAESLSEIFERLLAKQQILLERYNAMKDKLQISQEENEALKKENEKQRQLIEKLEMDKDFLQMARQIAPRQGGSRQKPCHDSQIGAGCRQMHRAA